MGHMAVPPSPFPALLIRRCYKLPARLIALSDRLSVPTVHRATLSPSESGIGTQLALMGCDAQTGLNGTWPARPVTSFHLLLPYGLAQASLLTVDGYLK